MKILIVTGIFPPDHGGPASYVPTISTHLAAGNEVLGVVTLSDSVSAPLPEYPFPVHRILRSQGKALRMAKTISLIRRLSKEADVIYLNGLVLEGVLAAKVLSRRAVVVKVVGDRIWEMARNKGWTSLELDDFLKTGKGLKLSLLKWLQKWYTSKADQVITPSGYLKQVVSQWGVPTGKIQVVYNAVPKPSISSKPTPTRWDCVTVARLVPWKGIGPLIEVCAERGFSLLVIGDGPLRAELEALADRLGMRGRVKFTGHLHHSRVAEAMREAKVFVLNSTYEGLPHIVLEAKMAGLPVVATAAGGTGETIRDGLDGSLVPVGDAQRLGEAIAFYLAHEGERKKAVEASHQFIAEQFSFPAMLRKTQDLLLQTAQGSVR